MRALTPSDVEMTDSYEWVIDAQVAFGEEFDEETYLFHLSKTPCFNLEI
ncbi:putative major head protein [Enterococcus phage EF-P10]|nr:putative major head protein [Enterococcus phage EF-P10]